MTALTAWSPVDTDANESVLYGQDVGTITNGLAGNGVVSGMTVTTSSGHVVAIAAGTFIVNGVYKAYAGGTLEMNIAETSPRWDIIEIRTDGVPYCVAGTAAATPVLPAITAGAIRIAKVYRPTIALGGSTIQTANIYNSRIILGACIMQVGTDTTNTSGNSSLVFPVAFPAGGYYYVFAQPGTYGYLGACRVSSVTNTGCNVAISTNGGATTYMWMAIYKATSP